MQANEPYLDPTNILAGKVVQPVLASRACTQTQSNNTVLLLPLDEPRLYFADGAVRDCRAETQADMCTQSLVWRPA